jgi:hypothetical protein
LKKTQAGVLRDIVHQQHQDKRGAGVSPMVDSWGSTIRIYPASPCGHCSTKNNSMSVMPHSLTYA